MQRLLYPLLLTAQHLRLEGINWHHKPVWESFTEDINHGRCKVTFIHFKEVSSEL